MRPVVVLAFALAAAGCAAPSLDASDEGEEASASSFTADRSCSLSRRDVLASVQGERRQAITRGFTWLDQDVPYSQTRTHEGYRADCSGFISMCWQAPKPGLWTGAFPTDASYARLDSYEDLLPGDAVNLEGTHIVLFLGWDDKKHTAACVLEQASTAEGMQFRTRTKYSMQRSGYKPLRPARFTR